MADTPTREHLAGLLAALRFGQYNTEQDYRKLLRNVDRALKNYDIGKARFVTDGVRGTDETKGGA